MKFNPEDIGHTGRLTEDDEVIKGDYFIFTADKCLIKKLTKDQVILYKLKDIQSVFQVTEISDSFIKYKTIHFVDTRLRKINYSLSTKEINHD